MNFSRLFSRLSTLSAFWVLLALAPVACGAATNLGPAVTNQPGGTNGVANSKTNSPNGTNAAPAELPVPVAVFDLTAKVTKDPFFPLSTRLPIPAVIITNTAPAFSPESFSLKGIDGPANMRLALINNRTMAVGETNELTTTTGRFKVKLVEIKDKSVIIRAENQPGTLEIFLRKADYNSEGRIRYKDPVAK